MDHVMETYLILKYRSMEDAFCAWLLVPVGTMPEEEEKAIMFYNEVKFPNLDLQRNNS